jgi:hypothetical protein
VGEGTRPGQPSADVRGGLSAAGEALATRRLLALTNDLAGALTTLADLLDGLDRGAAAAASAGGYAAARRPCGAVEPSCHATG